MFCHKCSKELGDKQPQGAHTVALGDCQRCGSKKVGIWPMRHFFSDSKRKEIVKSLGDSNDK